MATILDRGGKECLGDGGVSALWGCGGGWGGSGWERVECRVFEGGMEELRGGRMGCEGIGGRNREGIGWARMSCTCTHVLS